MPGSLSDAENLTAAIEAIYNASTDPAHWPAALQAIANCFGDVGAIMIYSSESGQLGTIVSPSMEAAQRAHAEGGWWQQDLRFERANERGYFSTTDAITDRHIATAHEMANHPYYVDFLASQGLQWFGATSVSPDTHTAAAVSVQRASGKAPFSEEELKLLVRIGRHVENSLRLSLRLMNAEASAMALSDTLSRLDVAIFMLTGDGRVVFENSTAVDLLGNAIAVLNGRLWLPTPAARAKLAESLSRHPPVAEGQLPNAIEPILIPLADNAYLAAYLVPCDLRSLPSGGGILAGTRFAMIVRRSEPGKLVEPSLARDLLGLTLAEAKVATLIASGSTPRDASERLQISEPTVRTQLKAVYSKTGVNRQAELSALLNRLALR